jgi:hypothetical protein
MRTSADGDGGHLCRGTTALLELPDKQLDCKQNLLKEKKRKGRPSRLKVLPLKLKNHDSSNGKRARR